MSGLPAEALQAAVAAALAPRLRIAYLPDEQLDNAYTLRMREILGTFGEVERYEGVKAALLRLISAQPQRHDLVVANWIENALINPATGRIAPLATLKLFLRTWLMTRFARQSAFVRHNAYPHAVRPGSARLAKRLVDALERMFDVVLTHSGAEASTSSRHRQRHYCPHPLYRIERAGDADGDDALSGFALPSRYFLVFGRLVAHKRLEKLIAAFPAEHNLVIAGAVGDVDYVKYLLALRRSNCFVRPGFLSEARAQQLVAQADGVVISHAEADVVVSGTFFYTLSVGRPVYAVATPFLRWTQPRIDPALLHLADDLDGLCELIRQAQPPAISATAEATVQREFGDAAVRQALATAFGFGAT